MSGLVGYASSDEEDDIQPDKPAKIAKTTVHHDTRPAAATKTSPPAVPQPPTSHNDPQQPLPAPSAGPAPSAPTLPEDGDPSLTPPASPYTNERGLLRNLTMPTHPNFNIPSSPSPPPPNSEAALTLSTTTKKFTRFLELKRQGVHFNARLENSASLRNPGLLPSLMEFAGISEEESRASTLQGGVPATWPKEWYVENLVKENETREKKRRKERGEVEFVRGKGGEGTGSKGSSKASTPKAGASEHRKSRFDR